VAESAEAVRAQIATILSENFAVSSDAVTDDATFRGTLGLDSLDVVDFVFFVQQGFSFEAQLADYRTLHSVKDLVSFVQEKTTGS
jgi:acyl carrier protein